MVMDSTTLVHKCLFCPQILDSASVKDEHILSHFTPENCLKCKQNLIPIGSNLYVLHDVNTCIEREPQPKAVIESSFTGPSTSLIYNHYEYAEANNAENHNEDQSSPESPFEEDVVQIKVEPIELISIENSSGNYKENQGIFRSIDDGNESISHIAETVNEISVKIEPMGEEPTSDLTDEIPSETDESEQVSCDICYDGILFSRANLRNHMKHVHDIANHRAHRIMDNQDDLGTYMREHNTREDPLQETMDEQPHSSNQWNQNEMPVGEFKVEPEEFQTVQNRIAEYEEQPRKKLKECISHKSAIAKEQVERGPEHVTQINKKLIPTKVFKAQTVCKCRTKKKLNCPRKITIKRQKQIFDAYNDEMCWSQKTLFIRSSVKREPVKTKKSQTYRLTPLKHKDFNYTYSLTDEAGTKTEVCRDFFSNCVQATFARIFRAIKSSESNPDASEIRGKGSSARKTSELHHQAVRNFIDRIPKYESHYYRTRSHKKYLHHSLNLRSLYREYRGKCDPQKRECVGETIFRRIFNTEYNLSFKRWQLCRTCDEINNSLKSVFISEEDKEELKTNQAAHLGLVEQTNAEFESDVEKAKKSDEKIVFLTFDLQKTLETPSLNNSIEFYKRQLWTYNLCVFDEMKQQGFMYVWSENIASRGGQEIGSCLLQHFRNHVPETTERIILWSNSCGGQNKNIKLTMLLKKYLHDLPPDHLLQSIKQKYLISGHSYNSCDRCFTKIGNYRKEVGAIFTPNDWAKVIEESKASSPTYKVYMMQVTDFISSKNLQAIIVNRKETLDGVQIDWHGIRSFEYRRDEPFAMHIVCLDGATRTVNIQKKKFNEETLSLCEVPSLYQNGIEISKDDLRRFNGVADICTLGASSIFHKFKAHREQKRLRAGQRHQ